MNRLRACFKTIVLKGALIVWIGVGCLIVVGAASAEEPAKRRSSPSAPVRATPSAPVMPSAEQLRKAQEQFQQQMEQSLEALKTTNPEMHRKLKTQMDQQQEISRIVTAYHKKTLSAQDAEKKLSSMVKAQVQGQLASIDQQIAWAKKQVSDLEAMKRDPDVAVKKQIDLLLGRVPLGELMPGAGMGMGVGAIGGATGQTGKEPQPVR